MPGPPSKHGLERKFKPWRKGKATKAAGIPVEGEATPGKKRNSLKNQLRSQRRLLSKLSDGDEGLASAIKEKIVSLEGGIVDYEKGEKEKSNAAKYHQVRFIERQKLTRLERATRRGLDDARRRGDAPAVERLGAELRSVALDQLYVAHFPADAKYLALFRQGKERVVDDERSAKKRDAIRKRIAMELKTGNGEGAGDGKADRGLDDGVEGGGEKKRIKTTKKWVNVDAASEALFSGAVPIATMSGVPDGGSIDAKDSRGDGEPAKSSSRRKRTKNKTAEGGPVPVKPSGGISTGTAIDSRFVLTKTQDDLFQESTTGEDYEKISAPAPADKDKGLPANDDGDDSSASDDSSLDDADPLEALVRSKGKPVPAPKVDGGDDASSSDSDTSSDDEATLDGTEKKDVSKPGPIRRDKKIDEGSESDSSSDESTGSSSDDSDSDSDGSEGGDDRGVVARPGANSQRPAQPSEDRNDRPPAANGVDAGSDDDFFVTDDTPAEKAFAKAKHHRDDFDGARGDKSRGFKTQRQRPGEYEAFRQKRKRMG